MTNTSNEKWALTADPVKTKSTLRSHFPPKCYPGRPLSLSCLPSAVLTACDAPHPLQLPKQSAGMFSHLDYIAACMNLGHKILQLITYFQSLLIHQCYITRAIFRILN